MIHRLACADVTNAISFVEDHLAVMDNRDHGTGHKAALSERVRPCLVEEDLDGPTIDILCEHDLHGDGRSRYELVGEADGSTLPFLRCDRWRRPSDQAVKQSRTSARRRERHAAPRDRARISCRVPSPHLAAIVLT